MEWPNGYCGELTNNRIARIEEHLARSQHVKPEKIRNFQNGKIIIIIIIIIIIVKMVQGSLENSLDLG